MPINKSTLIVDYPQVDTFVQNIVSMSTRDICCLLFAKRKNVAAGNFFRVRGGVTGHQIKQLAELHGVEQLRSRFVGEGDEKWVEYTWPIHIIDNFSLRETAFYNKDDYVDLSFVYTSFDDCNSGLLASVYLNGERVDYQKVRYKDLKKGDVVVILADTNQNTTGSLAAFEDMPTLEVYSIDLIGPFSYPYPGEYWASEVSALNAVRSAWKLRKGDIVLCPSCGKPECGDHILKSTDKVFVDRSNKAGQFMYAIQSSAFITDDASAVLKRFAPIVIGQRVANVWPRSVIRLTIDGSDKTRNTCAKDIQQGSVIKAYLSPIKYFSRTS